MGTGEVLGLEKRKVLLAMGAAVALLAGAIALVGQVADFGEMLAALERGGKPWLALCLAGQLLAYAGYIAAYRDMARANRGPDLGYGRSARVVALSFGAYAVGSAPGGLAVDFWALNRAGSGLHEAARRVLAFNTLEWAVLSIAAAGAAVAILLGRGEGAPLPMTLVWLIAVPLAVAAAAWVSSPARAERLSSLEYDEPERLGRDPRLWARWGWAELRKGFADAVGGLVLLRHVVARPHRYPGAVVGFPLYWFGQLLTLYGALRGFTEEGLVPAALVLGYVTGYAATALPLPAGGSGSIEASLAFSLHLVDIPLAAALLGVLVYRVFTFWLPLGPALALLPALGRLNEELPQTRRSTH